MLGLTSSVPGFSAFCGGMAWCLRLRAGCLLPVYGACVSKTREPQRYNRAGLRLAFFIKNAFYIEKKSLSCAYIVKVLIYDGGRIYHFYFAGRAYA